ncbi:MAG: hypothetical protein IPO27_07075 [Bacteroidetes bacterium]|nr:hypothetical protein [Bacteroidota bacterium]
MQKKLHLHKKEINISFGLGYLFNFYGTERGLGASEFLSGTKYYPNFVDSVKYTLFTDNTRRGTVSLQMNLSYLIINKEKWNLSLFINGVAGLQTTSFQYMNYSIYFFDGSSLSKKFYSTTNDNSLTFGIGHRF